MKQYAHWLWLPVPFAVLWAEFYLLWGTQHWLDHWWGIPLALSVVLPGAFIASVAIGIFVEKV